MYLDNALFIGSHHPYNIIVGRLQLAVNSELYDQLQHQEFCKNYELTSYMLRLRPLRDGACCVHLLELIGRPELASKLSATQSHSFGDFLDLVYDPSDELSV